MNDTFQELDVPMLATGFGSLMYINCLTERIDDGPLTGSRIGEVFDHKTQDLFQAYLMQQGVFGYHGLGGMSFTHSDEDLELTHKGVTEAVKQLQPRIHHAKPLVVAREIFSLLAYNFTEPPTDLGMIHIVAIYPALIASVVRGIDIDALDPALILR